MEVTYENKPEDIAPILKGLPWQDRLTDYWQTLRILLVVWPLAIQFAILREWFFLTGLLGIIALCALLLTILYWRAWANLSKNGKVIPGPLTMRLREDYLEMTAERGASRRRWQMIPDVRVLPEHVAVYIQKVRAYVVPKHYFSSPEEAEAFANKAQSLRTRALEQPSPMIDWEAFREDNRLDEFQLIEHLKWGPTPQLYARLAAMGIDADGKNSVPTRWDLFKQLLWPFFLTLLLLGLRFQLGDEPHILYYLVLTMSSIFLLSFGLQWHSRSQYLRELSAQESYHRPYETWLYEEGVATLTEEAIGFSRWSVLDQVSDDREAIVIYATMPDIYVAIPKAVLPDRERQAAVLERLKYCVDLAHDRHEVTVLPEVSDNPFQSPST